MMTELPCESKLESQAGHPMNRVGISNEISFLSGHLGSEQSATSMPR